MLLHYFPTPLLLAAALTAQPAITWAEGSSPTDLSVLTVAEASAGTTPTTLLSGAELLPLEITNRTRQQELRTDVARRLLRDGVARVELPQNGRLLRYRQAAGPRRYGLLWIDAHGNPSVVWEANGIGASGLDPLADRFAVAPDGRHAALTDTTGGLILVRLDGAVFASTGLANRRIPVTGAVEPKAVAVGSTQLFFVTANDRIWRCPLTDGATPTDLTPLATGANIRLKDELAPSDDGTAVAFIYGPKDNARLYLLRSSGAATLLPPPSAKYEEPGYLPETTGGPRLLLNRHATRLLYTDATSRDEIFLLDTTGATAPTHVTSDANFQPYIGVGIFPSFAADTLRLAVGDPAKLDWYATNTGATAVVNLTHTAAETAPPWGVGQLAPRAGYPLPSGDVLSEEVTQTGAVQLRRIDPIIGTSAILAADLRGRVAQGRGDSATPHLLVPDRAGDLLLSASAGLLQQSIPAVDLSPDTLLPDGLSSVFRASISTTSAVILRLPNGALFALPPMTGLRQVVPTERWGLLLNAGELRYLHSTGAVLVAPSAAERIVLS